MNMDENVFFREATLRICCSLDIETALKRCFEYIGAFIPVIGTTLHTLDYDLNLMQLVASVGVNQLEGCVVLCPKPDDRGFNSAAVFTKIMRYPTSQGPRV